MEILVQMSQKEAGEILDLGKRQIKRLLKSYRKQGAVGFRGRKGNNRFWLKLFRKITSR